MATVLPGPSSGGTGLNRTRPRPASWPTLASATRRQAPALFGLAKYR
jgi:hypothetical protein